MTIANILNSLPEDFLISFGNPMVAYASIEDYLNGETFAEQEFMENTTKFLKRAKALIDDNSN